MAIRARLWSAISETYAAFVDEERSIVEEVVELALRPLRIATSPAALKAYLSIFVFFFSSATLISVSTTAYLVFYYRFIPQIDLEKTVYFQYSHDNHPHATVALQTDALISQQAYDVEVILHMPLSPINIAAGNFMLDVSLLSETNSALTAPLSYVLSNTTRLADEQPFYRSRRPAMLPYASHITGLSHTLLHLPAHLLSLRDVDSTNVVVPMFEHVSFPRGRKNIPTHAYIELQSQIPPVTSNENCSPQGLTPSQSLHVLSLSQQVQTRHLQVYDAKLRFRARFAGLRYLVYNYRVVSFLMFTTMFYLSAVTSMAAAWMTFASFRRPHKSISEVESSRRIKQENGTGSATETKRRSRIKMEPGSGGSYPAAQAEVKAEDDSDSSNVSGEGAQTDSSTTFPGIGRTVRPLRYPGSGSGTGSGIGAGPSNRSLDATQVNSQPADDPIHDAGDEEEEEEEDEAGQIIARMGGSGEAYIKEEDDDDDGLMVAADSGIGTSMESEQPGGSLVRRRSGRNNRTSR